MYTAGYVPVSSKPIMCIFCLQTSVVCWYSPETPKFFWFFFLPHSLSLVTRCTLGHLVLQPRLPLEWVFCLSSPKPSPTFPPLLHRQRRVKVSASPTPKVGLCAGSGAAKATELMDYFMNCTVCFLNKLRENYILCWAYDYHNSLSHNKIVSQKGEWNCCFFICVTNHARTEGCIWHNSRYWCVSMKAPLKAVGIPHLVQSGELEQTLHVMDRS